MTVALFIYIDKYMVDPFYYRRNKESLDLELTKLIDNKYEPSFLYQIFEA